VRGTPVVAGAEIAVAIVQTWSGGPVLVLRTLFDHLGRWQIVDEHLGQPRARADAAPVSYADRVCVLLANRLTRPSSAHGLARWLETDFVCDRWGRRFVPRWHRHGRVRVHGQQRQTW
jgi:hypothetical protein